MLNIIIFSTDYRKPVYTSGTLPEFSTKDGSVSYERQKCNVSCALDGNGQSSLVLCTCTCHTLRQDLAALGNELAKTSCILVIDFLDLICAESTNLSSGTSLLHATIAKLTTGSLRCSIFSHNNVISFRKSRGHLTVRSGSRNLIRQKGAENCRQNPWTPQNPDRSAVPAAAVASGQRSLR